MREREREESCIGSESEWLAGLRYKYCAHTQHTTARSIADYPCCFVELHQSVARKRRTTTNDHRDCFFVLKLAFHNADTDTDILVDILCPCRCRRRGTPAYQRIDVIVESTHGG